MPVNVVVFCNGDACDASTWSNVPYMFLRSLHRIRPDVNVLAEDIRLEDTSLMFCLISKIWNRAFTPHLGKLCTFDRTSFYRSRIVRRMRKTMRQAGRAGVALTFDFSNPAPRVDEWEVCLLCDWTIEYEIREHQRREPTRFERKLIARQKEAIAAADCVTVLFPRSAELIGRASGGVRVLYLGLPANLPDGERPNFDRWNSDRLVFIGSSAYREGLRVIADGLLSYNQLHPEKPFYLDVIGMDCDDSISDDHVVFHGYLRKDISGEHDLYYSILKSAKALISVSDTWVGASSIVEALALGTPVIISPNSELREMFDNKDCGIWCGCSAGEVQASLERLDRMSELELEAMCKAAEESVRGYTWDCFVERWCDAVGI